ncbi:hypothetical protein lerEdw1_011160 [Lerista edwardsae]|nr:hypothetical protein lerEdw1_011160 [Lerista edwardsae]
MFLPSLPPALLFLVASAASFPKDLTPLSTVGLAGTARYPYFHGLAGDNDTAQLGLDFQLMLRLNRTLLIAARDHVYAFDLQQTKDNFSPTRYLTWKTQNMENCAMRGKLWSECYNYIKVLVPKSDQTLLACGTNVFNPACRTYKISTLQQEGEELNGQARCPFDPQQTNVALFAGGNLYSATVADFQASDAVVYRSLGDRSPVLRTVKYDSKWLREPHFLHALEYGDHVYFFFREISMEYTTLGRVVFSRVGRVCKNDMGGSPRVLEKYWTSFLKARLNCSVPGDSFFYFDVLQAVTDVTRVHGRATIFGVFTTQSNSITGSAVCAFYMDEVERAFSGKFKEQRNADAAWTPISEDKVPKPRPGSCAGIGAATGYKSSNDFPDEMLGFIKSFPLLDEAVPSVSERPWFTKTSDRYKLTRLAVDPAAGPFRNYTVLFLGSEDGKVLKVLSSTTENSTVETVLLEEISVYSPAWCNFRKDDRRVLGLELDKANHALYVAFSGCVVRVPLSRCAAYGACRRSCLASRDPYCVWLRTAGACVPIGADVRNGFEQDVENATGLLGNCQDVVAATGNRDGTSDSAYGRTQTASATAAPSSELPTASPPPPSLAPDARPAPGGGEPHSTLHVAVSTQGVRQEADAPTTVHYTFLIGCVFVAFALGAFLSGLLVSCYCSHALQKAALPHKDPEGGTLPRPLSLRSLAKLNGHLLEGQPKDGRTEVLLPSEKEPPKAGLRDPHPELSGLPTPDSTPELPLKNVKALRNQWEKNQNFNNAKEAQAKAQLFRTHAAAASVQAIPFPGAAALPGHLHGYEAPLAGFLEEKKVANAERGLGRHSHCFLPSGGEGSALEELLRHLHEASGSPRKGAPLAFPGPGLHPAPAAAAAASFANRVQPKIPDVETAPYYSSSTLPRDSLPRRLDIPPDPPPPPAHRHSLCAAPKLVDEGRPLFLSRLHGYGDPALLPSHSGLKRSVSMVKPGVLPKPVFMPSSPPAQFKY